MADTQFLFRNASVLDVERGELVPDRSVLVREDRIVEVGGPGLSAGDAIAIDVRGRTLMPGLIDGHVHVNAVTADLAALEHWPSAYVTARAGGVLAAMLHRGFTTVRDAGGADHGLADAIEEGYLPGPRVVFGDKALSQSGGHGDQRKRGQVATGACGCGTGIISVLCDGVPEVRRAAREQIRRGAHHIKVMLSGGIASPTDRIDSTQFSIDEIRAIVEEAEAANVYVCGHAYTARAVNRGLEAGVRSIEHGNLMDESSVALFKEKEAFYVPTLATYAVLVSEGPENGLPPASVQKASGVLEAGLHALELAHRAGIRIVYGTDLLGGMHQHQLSEFRLRAQVQPPADILRAATTVAARLLRMEGQIGVIAPGAFADLLVVDGNPLDDVALLTDPARNLKVIMARGQLVSNALQ